MAEAEAARVLMLKVYEHEDFKGASTVYTGKDGPCDAEGYRIPDLGSFKDRTSSMVMYNNCIRVRAYQEANYQGENKTYYGDRVASVGTTMDDKIVSATVRYEPLTLLPGNQLTAVSLGDSYISGEAGRWHGNSTELAGTREGTDRAAVNCGPIRCEYDPARIYGGTTVKGIPTFARGGNGCHRSDVAEIEEKSSHLPVQLRVNLACSGAQTKHIDGEVLKGEQPQIEQLKNVARQSQVKMVVLSIGGNDLKFNDIVKDCVLRFGLGMEDCRFKGQAAVNKLMPTVRADIAETIKKVRDALKAEGDTDYRFILQSYPSAVPRGEDVRFSGPDRAVRGCPMKTNDLTWARDGLIPEISKNLREVAKQQEGVDFLDLQDAFEGREVCGRDSKQSDEDPPVSGSTSEWARSLSSGATGNLQESVHPNAYGQAALGACLEKMTASPAGSYACTNAGPGTPPAGMSVKPISS
ncbi:GDSL-type esterase/lipase family protein [Streptomyces sp. NPDC050704]|uniref:GDSL-type esterase/lipase family protein n=1 Tax=Streptomyces sp. NPDC050704 TaxID=3157219 RepID=UPI00343213B1